MSLAGFDYRGPDIRITTASAGVADPTVHYLRGLIQESVEKRNP